MSAEDTDSNAQIIHPARVVLILLGYRTCQLWKLERGRGWHANKGTGTTRTQKGMNILSTTPVASKSSFK